VLVEAIRFAPKCSEEVACEWREKVVEDVDDGCTELLGLGATQECIIAAVNKEVAQYIESAASRALDARGTSRCYRKPGSGLLIRPGSLQRLAGSAMLYEKSPFMMGLSMISQST